MTDLQQPTKRNQPIATDPEQPLTDPQQPTKSNQPVATKHSAIRPIATDQERLTHSDRYQPTATQTEAVKSD